jgi:hypothetical protein
MWADVLKSADPIAERRQKRALGRDAREGIGTLKALLDLYADHGGAELKSWPECRRRINSVFAPCWALARFIPEQLSLGAVIDALSIAASHAGLPVNEAQRTLEARFAPEA